MRMKREREILRNYMEVLSQNYQKIEPNEMSSSICRIYDSLNASSDRIVRNLAALVFVYTLICIAVLIVDFFRRKT